MAPRKERERLVAAIRSRKFHVKPRGITKGLPKHHKKANSTRNAATQRREREIELQMARHQVPSLEDPWEFESDFDESSDEDEDDPPPKETRAPPVISAPMITIRQPSPMLNGKEPHSERRRDDEEREKQLRDAEDDMIDEAWGVFDNITGRHPGHGRPFTPDPSRFLSWQRLRFPKRASEELNMSRDIQTYRSAGLSFPHFEHEKDKASAEEHRPSPADIVFGITELATMVLEHLGTAELLAMRSVNRGIFKAIRGTRKFGEKLFLAPSTQHAWIMNNETGELEHRLRYQDAYTPAGRLDPNAYLPRRLNPVVFQQAEVRGAWCEDPSSPGLDSLCLLAQFGWQIDEFQDALTLLPIDYRFGHLVNHMHISNPPTYRIAITIDCPFPREPDGTRLETEVYNYNGIRVKDLRRAIIDKGVKPVSDVKTIDIFVMDAMPGESPDDDPDDVAWSVVYPPEYFWNALGPGEIVKCPKRNKGYEDILVDGMDDMMAD